jgi:hypothetical protein
MTHTDSGFLCFREAWDDCKVLQGLQWRRVYSGGDWLTTSSFSNRKFRVYTDRSFITSAFLRTHRFLKINRTTGAIKNYADQYPDCQVWRYNQMVEHHHNSKAITWVHDLDSGLTSQNKGIKKY